MLPSFSYYLVENMSVGYVHNIVKSLEPDLHSKDPMDWTDDLNAYCSAVAYIIIGQLLF